MFISVQASDILALTRHMSYHLNEMSDFEAELNQRHGALLVEAMALDYVMWNAKNHRSRMPWALLSGESEPPYYGGLPNYASEADLSDQAKQFEAELVYQIYWQGKPAPRQTTQESPESSAYLYGDTERPHVSFEVRELADRLGITERHVRRKLAALLKAGKVPADWRVGKQWRPSVDEAEKIIRAADGKKHKPHTHAAADGYADFLVQCRRDAERLKRELEEAGGKLKVCKEWIRLTRIEGLAPVEYDKARERGFKFMCRLAETRRWKFCKLLMGTYAAVLNKAQKPVQEAIGFLGLSHIAFYRTYTKKEIREALRMAEMLVTNSNWMGYEPQLEQNTDADSPPFSDWADKVSEKDLWAGLH